MPHSDARRYAQLERILLLIELIAPLRQGATSDELTGDVCQSLYQTSSRTIRRDLNLLARIGLVDRVEPSRDRFRAGGPPRWVWNDKSVRSVILEFAAVRRSELAGR